MWISCAKGEIVEEKLYRIFKEYYTYDIHWMLAALWMIFYVIIWVDFCCFSSSFNILSFWFIDCFEATISDNNETLVCMRLYWVCIDAVWKLCKDDGKWLIIIILVHFSNLNQLFNTYQHSSLLYPMPMLIIWTDFRQRALLCFHLNEMCRGRASTFLSTTIYVTGRVKMPQHT